ncbi:MAG: GIY-YIG nuclease family protein [bacterium]|nr:GIY-YIG nuclease family protein [bacterium]
MWYVYILECVDKSYYVGMTPNLERRFNEHNTGRGGFWTGLRRPVTLKYSEKLKTRTDAEARELQLKGWSRKKKEALMSGNVLSLSRHRQDNKS